MKEREVHDGIGLCLYVYPHLPVDAPDREMGGAANVEARRYWGRRGNEPPRWGVRVNASYGGFMTREESATIAAELQAAIARCWQWVDEQESAEDEDPRPPAER